MSDIKYFKHFENDHDLNPTFVRLESITSVTFLFWWSMRKSGDVCVVKLNNGEILSITDMKTIESIIHFLGIEAEVGLDA